MQALEVSVNGRRICVAATVPNKVLATGVTWSSRDPEYWRFNLGGVLGGESREHFAWDVPKLTVGDEICIRIIESDTYDEPDRTYDPAATQ